VRHALRAPAAGRRGVAVEPLKPDQNAPSLLFLAFPAASETGAAISGAAGAACSSGGQTIGGGVRSGVALNA